MKEAGGPQSSRDDTPSLVCAAPHLPGSGPGTEEGVARELGPGTLWGRRGWERTGKGSQSSPGWRTSPSWHVGLSVYAPVPGALYARMFSTCRQRGHCRHIHHPRLPPLGGLSLQRNAALHSSHLNGARDHSPVLSLQFLAEPITQGLPRPGRGTQPATRAPAGTSGEDGLPGSSPRSAASSLAGHLRLSGPSCPLTCTGRDDSTALLGMVGRPTLRW